LLDVRYNYTEMNLMVTVNKTIFHLIILPKCCNLAAEILIPVFYIVSVQKTNNNKGEKCLVSRA